MGNITSNNFDTNNVGQMYIFRGNNDERNYDVKMRDMSKLNKFIMKTLNEKYYVINNENNNSRILLKRAMCTGQIQIPISLPYVKNNEITEYSIMVPVYYPANISLPEDEDDLTSNDFNAALTNIPIEKANYDDNVRFIPNEKNETKAFFKKGINIDTRLYGHLKDGGVNESSTGCELFYLGNSNGKFDLSGGMCKTVLDYRRSIGKDWNETELCDSVNDARTLNCNGQDQKPGNDFHINTFRDCNCVLTSITEKLRTTDNKIVNDETREYYAQNLDERCKQQEYTFTTGNKLQSLCANIAIFDDTEINVEGKNNSVSINQNCHNQIGQSAFEEWQDIINKTKKSSVIAAAVGGSIAVAVTITFVIIYVNKRIKSGSYNVTKPTK